MALRREFVVPASGLSGRWLVVGPYRAVLGTWGDWGHKRRKPGRHHHLLTRPSGCPEFCHISAGPTAFATWPYYNGFPNLTISIICSALTFCPRCESLRWAVPFPAHSPGIDRCATGWTHEVAGSPDRWGQASPGDSPERHRGGHTFDILPHLRDAEDPHSPWLDRELPLAVCPGISNVCASPAKPGIPPGSPRRRPSPAHAKPPSPARHAAAARPDHGAKWTG